MQPLHGPRQPEATQGKKGPWRVLEGHPKTTMLESTCIAALLIFWKINDFSQLYFLCSETGGQDRDGWDSTRGRWVLHILTAAQLSLGVS